jgi:cell envelope opacity-associated protein A
MKKKSGIDKKIDNLKPGQSIALSSDSDAGVLVAERSGNGKKLTLLRQKKDGSFRVLSVRSF